jgi:hypothetical protein
MTVVAFVAPYFTENAKLFIQAVSSVPGVELGLVSQEPVERLAPPLREKVRAFVQVDDALDANRLCEAAGRISSELGPLRRLTAAIEQIQVPLAEARARLGLPGMKPEVALNFRDKNKMKDRLREAGLPVARHKLVTKVDEARQFAADVGYPVVVKPPLGVASQTTYRVEREDELFGAVSSASAAARGPVVLEVWLTGTEHSFDAFVQAGQVRYHSISRYEPSCLTAMQNPWIQWNVILPREVDSPAYDDIAKAGARALAALGLEDGMCHLEWFRRPDGTLAISEVGARPPGAQITTMISRAHDVDCRGAWARLEIEGRFDPFPPRKFAAGGAYLRGQGQGRVRAVHGMDVVQRELGPLITDVRLPSPGQEKGASYEGEGFVLLRHPETKVVEEALRRVVSTVRVELG